jgi:hypothetical protein
MKLSRELEAQILAMPGVQVRHAGSVEPAPAPKAKPELVEPSVILAGGKLTAEIPVETVSEINDRKWKARSRRTGKAWKAVSRTICPHLILLASFAAAYHRGQALRIVFTRLGGKRLDRSNLPTALKATEDSVAYLLGADDGDPRWRAAWEQQPGGAVGVRVEITVETGGE